MPRKRAPSPKKEMDDTHFCLIVSEGLIRSLAKCAVNRPEPIDIRSIAASLDMDAELKWEHFQDIIDIVQKFSVSYNQAYNSCCFEILEMVINLYAYPYFRI